MAARAIKKMGIGIAGATLGVAVMTASDDHAGLKFRLRHAADGGDVKQPRVCGTCGIPLKGDDVVREYVFEDGVTVAVDAEDFEFAAGRRGSVLDIDRFIPRDTLSPVATDKSYYLIPIDYDDIAYASLAQAMDMAGVVAVTSGMVGSSERLYAIVPIGGRVLALQTLNYAEDIRRPEKLGHLSEPDGDLTRAFGTIIGEMLAPDGDLSDIDDEFAGRMKATLLLKRKGILPGLKKAPEIPGTDIAALRRIVESVVAGTDTAGPVARTA